MNLNLCLGMKGKVDHHIYDSYNVQTMFNLKNLFLIYIFIWTKVVSLVQTTLQSRLHYYI